MSRWIDADALIMALRLEYPMMPMFKENQKEWGIKTEGYRKAEEVIKDAPSIDIEPKRGEWIVHKERTEVNDGFIDFFPTEYECSNCGLKQSMYFINSKPSNFCPNCGADMRGEDDEQMD